MAEAGSNAPHQVEDLLLPFSAFSPFQHDRFWLTQLRCNFRAPTPPAISRGATLVALVFVAIEHSTEKRPSKRVGPAGSSAPIPIANGREGVAAAVGRDRAAGYGVAPSRRRRLKPDAQLDTAGAFREEIGMREDRAHFVKHAVDPLLLELDRAGSRLGVS